MGYVGNWISGHSGTAQKNKKAFSQKRKWANGLPVTDRQEGGGIVGRYKLHHGRADISDWMIGLFFVFIIGAGCWWFQGLTSSFSAEQTVIETEQEGFTEAQRHAYSFLVESGKKNLVLKDYRVASYEFNEALKIKARLGLLKAMRLRCSERGGVLRQGRRTA